MNEVGTKDLTTKVKETKDPKDKRLMIKDLITTDPKDKRPNRTKYLTGRKT